MVEIENNVNSKTFYPLNFVDLIPFSALKCIHTEIKISVLPNKVHKMKRGKKQCFESF